jgi:hypothetical protein
LKIVIRITAMRRPMRQSKHTDAAGSRWRNARTTSVAGSRPEGITMYQRSLCIGVTILMLVVALLGLLSGASGAAETRMPPRLHEATVAATSADRAE